MLGCYSVKKLASVKTIKVNINILWEKSSHSWTDRLDPRDRTRSRDKYSASQWQLTHSSKFLT